MARMREVEDDKQFSFFESFWRQFEMLDMSTRGEYITAICRMAFDGEDTEFDNPMLQFGWSVMRSQVRKSVQVHKAAVERGRASAKARAKRQKKKDAVSETFSEKLSETFSERQDMTLPDSGAPSESRPNGGLDEIDLDNLPPMQ